MHACGMSSRLAFYRTVAYIWNSGVANEMGWPSALSKSCRGPYTLTALKCVSRPFWWLVTTTSWTIQALMTFLRSRRTHAVSAGCGAGVGQGFLPTRHAVSHLSILERSGVTYGSMHSTGHIHAQKVITIIMPYMICAAGKKAAANALGNALGTSGGYTHSGFSGAVRGILTHP